MNASRPMASAGPLALVAAVATVALAAAIVSVVAPAPEPFVDVARVEAAAAPCECPQSEENGLKSHRARPI